MPWVRIDEETAHNPKVRKAGPLGLAMQVAALCYCNQYLTDGFVAREEVHAFLNLDGLGMRIWTGEISGGGEDASWQLVVEDLVTAGLWTEVPGGWQIHDYEDYQPSKEEVLAQRERNRKAGQKGGEQRAKQGANRGVKQPVKRGASGAPSALSNGPPSKSQANRQAKAQAKSKPVPVPGVATQPPGNDAREAASTPEPEAAAPQGAASADERQATAEDIRRLREEAGIRSNRPVPLKSEQAEGTPAPDHSEEPF